MIIYKLLDKWGIDGFLDHSDKVTDFYKQRRDVMLAAANKHMTGRVTAYVTHSNKTRNN